MTLNYDSELMKQAFCQHHTTSGPTTHTNRHFSVENAVNAPQTVITISCSFVLLASFVFRHCFKINQSIPV